MLKAKQGIGRGEQGREGMSRSEHYVRKNYKGERKEGEQREGKREEGKGREEKESRGVQR